MRATRATLIAALASGLLIALHPHAMAQEFREQRLARYLSVHKDHQQEIQQLRGVTGSGVGLSSRNPEELVIQLYVSPSTPEAVRRALPTQIDGVPVEVVEMGSFQTQ